MHPFFGLSARIHQLWVGALVLASLSAAANMASPLYPTYQQAYDMSEMTMTALYATFAASALPALLLFGSAADALGKRPVLLGGLVCAAAGTGLFAADIAGVPGLFLARVLLGIGLGLGTGAGIALLVEASPLSRPSLGSTLATVAFVAGTGAGPGMAGVVAEFSGATTTAPFVIMLGVLGLATAAVGLLRVQRPQLRQRWRPTWPAVPAATRSSFSIAAVSGFLGWSAVGVFLALLPSVAESVLDEPSLAISGTVVATVLLVSATSQLVAVRFSPRTAQTLGLTGLACGMALLLSSYLPIFTQRGALVCMAVAAVATGFGHGLSYWGANRESDVLTPDQHRAGVTAAMYLAFYAGAGLPALAVGLLTLNASLPAAIMVITMILMFATITFLPVPGLRGYSHQVPATTAARQYVISSDPAASAQSAESAP